ncbi:MAG: AMP-binding protein [Porticoccaceae bacterium]
MFTLKDLVRRTVLTKRHCYAVCSDDGNLTWEQFHDRVERIAGALIAAGLKAGDRVAIMSLNNPVYFQLLYGVIWAGGIVVPINTRYAPKEVETCLDDLDGCWLASDEHFVEILSTVEPQILGIKGHFYVGKGAVPQGYTGFDALLEGDSRLVTDDPHTTDVALIFYTGGTTGKAKGVMLTHQQLKYAAQQIAAAFHTDRPLCFEDRYLHSAPMFHMADGIMCFVTAMLGCANTFMERFNVPEFVEHCNRYGISWITLVPTMVKALCDYLQETGQTIPNIKGIMYGGSPMPRATLAQIMDVFGDVQLFHGYGSTEGLIITLLEPKYHTLDEENARLLKSVGKPFHGVLLGIFDADEKPLSYGEVGEVYVRSNGVMKGYWRNPGQTAEALRNNWYHTGDAGYVSEDGFLFLVDRVKDMIISGGENIYSIEVENAISTHPNVDEVAVIGRPDSCWGEIVHAVVKCKNGRTLTHEELAAHCRQWIAGYKVPKSIEFVAEPLPKTPVGKINKTALREAQDDKAQVS